MAAVGSHKRGATIAFRVQPRGSRTELIASTHDHIRLRVAAPPVDGAANAEIVTWLSKTLKVPKNRVEFLSGERGRNKVVLIAGASVEQVRSALELV